MGPKSPQKAAAGSGGNGKGRAASPKQKAPAKKAKSDEEVVAEELNAGEEALEEGQAGKGPAARTRAKGDGASAGAAAKKTAASAAENLLPQVNCTNDGLPWQERCAWALAACYADGINALLPAPFHATPADHRGCVAGRPPGHRGTAEAV